MANSVLESIGKIAIGVVVGVVIGNDNSRKVIVDSCKKGAESIKDIFKKDDSESDDSSDI